MYRIYNLLVSVGPCILHKPSPLIWYKIVGLTHFSIENWIFWDDKLNSTAIFTLNSNLSNGHYWRIAKARATTPLISTIHSSHIVFALAFCSHHNCQQCKSSNGKRREQQTERARDTSFRRYHQTANPRTKTQTQEAEEALDAINNKLATKELVTHWQYIFCNILTLDSIIFDFDIISHNLFVWPKHIFEIFIQNLWF